MWKYQTRMTKIKSHSSNITGPKKEKKMLWPSRVCVFWEKESCNIIRLREQYSTPKENKETFQIKKP